MECKCDITRKNQYLREFIEFNGISNTDIIYLMKQAVFPNKENSGKVFEIVSNMIETSKTTNSESQVSQEDVIPSHYTNFKVEPIVFIHMAKLDFCQGNIIKYLSRLGKKDDSIKELKKVFFYFDFLYNGNYDVTKAKYGNT